jgi:hypothetical protein
VAAAWLAKLRARASYSFFLFDGSVTGVTALSLVPFQKLATPEGEEMGTKASKLAVIFATVVVMAGLLVITTWAAVPKSHSHSGAPSTGTIYRPDLPKVY